MKNKIIKHIILVFSLTFLNTFLFSQQNKTTIISETVFKPVLPKIKKISEHVKILKSDNIINKFKYDIIHKRINVSHKIDSILPATISRERLTKLHRIYTKFGIGNYFTPLLQVYYNQTRNKTNNFGVGLEHLSSLGPKDYINSGYSKNKVLVYNNFFFDKYRSFKLSTFYDREVRHTYGKFDKMFENIKTPSINKNLYHHLNFTTDYKKNRKDSSEIDYNINLAYNLVRDILGENEHNINVKGNFSTYREIHLLKIGTQVYYGNLVNQIKQSSFILGLNPQIITVFKEFNFRLGLKLFYSKYSFQDNNYTGSFRDRLKDREGEFNVYPDFDVSYNVIDQILTPYVGMSGDVKNYNLLSSYKTNPFINYSNFFMENNSMYNIYMGLKGKLTDYWNYNVRFTHQSVKNMPLYINERNQRTISYTNFYSIIFDNVKLNQFYGELNYHGIEKIDLFLDFKYNQYDPRKQIKAWHMPEIESAFRLLYNINNKLLGKLEATYLGRQYAILIDSFEDINNFNKTIKEKQINGVVDLNLGFEYRYTKKLSVWLNFTNILNQKYQRWNNYPTQGFGVMGGITYSFQ